MAVESDDEDVGEQFQRYFETFGRFMRAFTFVAIVVVIVVILLRSGDDSSDGSLADLELGQQSVWLSHS